MCAIGGEHVDEKEADTGKVNAQIGGGPFGDISPVKRILLQLEFSD